MTNYPTAQQSSSVYTLTSGIEPTLKCVFNNPADAQYVGGLIGPDAVSGLDSPEVRTAIYDMVEADGAILGPQYHGMRPITLQCTIQGSSITERNQREALLRRVVNGCSSATGSLRWTPDGSIEQYALVRKYQRLQIKGGVVKDCMVSLVSGFPWIQSWAARTANGNYNTNVIVENQGDSFAPPTSVIATGPGTGPLFRRTYGAQIQELYLPGLTLTAGESVTLNPWDRTVVKNTGANLFSYLDIGTSDWWTLGPGNNTIRLEWDSGSPTTASDLDVNWRDSWL